MTATAAFAAADSKGKARTLGRRGVVTSAASSTSPSPAQSRPPARWSWLRATACSSIVVVSLAYVHSEASRYLAVAPTTRQPQPTSQQQLQVALAAAATVAWFVALVLSRQLRLHAPLQRLGKRVVSAAEQLRSLRDGHAMRLRRTRLSQRRHSWGYFGVDRDVDELDRLVVTSLSPERNVLPYTTSKARRDSTQTEPDRSSSSSNSAARAADDGGATGRQIVLNPRGGARGGRHPSNQIVSDDPFVSRYHFQIQYDAMEKEYFLQDLGSTTGTFVFLKPHVPKRLHATDRVKLGDTEFEVVAVDVNPVTGTPFLRLCFTDGPLAGVAQTIGKTAVTLGRRSSNALCITDDASISGRHSVLAHLGDGFYITDLDSTNGTAVRLSASGDKSARRYLRHGDVFGVGSNRFLVEYSHQLDAQRGLQVPVHLHHD
ncbi:hypothetical protein PybrP1_004345 [[Pythium] brassicae (nom. inval.)]|nr:hypothetical protein PybrP1_004345 [[Pythium] brassicae (nom. inval.)]